MKNLVHSYRLLGLSATAPLPEVKSAYRRLARLYHPDMNPHNPSTGDYFSRITTAYQEILAATREPQTPTPAIATMAQPRPRHGPRKMVLDPPPAQQREYGKILAPYEHQLKWQTYLTLRQLLAQGRLPRAIALMEGLSARLPHDAEVRQWQGLVYQQQGKSLCDRRQFRKARSYFQKALRVDPHNRTLQRTIQGICDRLPELTPTVSHHPMPLKP